MSSYAVRPRFGDANPQLPQMQPLDSTANRSNTTAEPPASSYNEMNMKPPLTGSDALLTSSPSASSNVNFANPSSSPAKPAFGVKKPMMDTTQFGNEKVEVKLPAGTISKTQRYGWPAATLVAGLALFPIIHLFAVPIALFGVGWLLKRHWQR